MGAVTGGALHVMRFVISVANEPAQRFKFLWYAVAWIVAVLFMILGAGYLIGGDTAQAGPSLHLVKVVERDLHIHGALLMAASSFLIYGLSDYRRVTRYALLVVFVYSLWVAVLIFGQFAEAKASWGAPWWYLAVTTLTGVLLILAPPLGPTGRRWGTEGSGSA